MSGDCAFDRCAPSFAETMIDRALAVLMGRTPAQDRWFVARTWPLKPEDMPGGLIFFHEETQTSKGMGAPPTFDSEPKLVFEGVMRGDDAQELHRQLDRFRQLVINLLMTSVDFLADPLEKVTSIKSIILEKDQQYQYHRFQLMLTLQVTEVYQPGPFPDLTLIDLQLQDPKGRTFAEVKFEPQA
jgi:hypothetical protein